MTGQPVHLGSSYPLTFRERICSHADGVAVDRLSHLSRDIGVDGKCGSSPSGSAGSSSVTASIQAKHSVTAPIARSHPESAGIQTRCYRDHIRGKALR
jgi:hypothetical protein